MSQRLMLSSPGVSALMIIMASMLLTPCGGDLRSPAGNETTQGQETTDVEPTGALASSGPDLGSERGSNVEPSAPPSAATPAEPDRRAHRRELPLISPITSDIAAHIITIAERATRDEHVFAKMGGSSVESRAYLHCLARDRNLVLGEHEDLRPAIEFFRTTRIAGQTPFTRQSTAAQVGWSLRQGLTGRPSRIIQEARATNARWALAFWGGNDVQGRNPRRYAERLLTLITQLESRGVVPVLAATTPRGDNEEMNVWARRYNQVTRGLAEALSLPYVDFYRAIDGLPNHGLAGDGVHPNVLLDGGRARPCDFSAEGLQRGQNQRNLRTMEMLHALVGAPRRQQRLTVQTPTAEPLAITGIPFAEEVQPAGSAYDGYSCPDAPVGEGAERVYRIEVDEPFALNLQTFRDDANLFYLGADGDPIDCVSWARRELSVVLTPGVHYFTVEVESDTAPILIIDETIP